MYIYLPLKFIYHSAPVPHVCVQETAPRPCGRLEAFASGSLESCMTQIGAFPANCDTPVAGFELTPLSAGDVLLSVWTFAAVMRHSTCLPHFAKDKKRDKGAIGRHIQWLQSSFGHSLHEPWGFARHARRTYRVAATASGAAPGTQKNDCGQPSRTMHPAWTMIGRRPSYHWQLLHGAA